MAALRGQTPHPLQELLRFFAAPDAQIRGDSRFAFSKGFLHEVLSGTQRSVRFFPPQGEHTESFTATQPKKKQTPQID